MTINSLTSVVPIQTNYFRATEGRNSHLQNLDASTENPLKTGSTDNTESHVNQGVQQKSSRQEISYQNISNSSFADLHKSSEQLKTIADKYNNSSIKEDDKRKIEVEASSLLLNIKDHLKSISLGAPPGQGQPSVQSIPDKGQQRHLTVPSFHLEININKESRTADNGEGKPNTSIQSVIEQKHSFSSKLKQYRHILDQENAHTGNQIDISVNHNDNIIHSIGTVGTRDTSNGLKLGTTPDTPAGTTYGRHHHFGHGFRKTSGEENPPQASNTNINVSNNPSQNQAAEHISAVPGLGNVNSSGSGLQRELPNPQSSTDKSIPVNVVLNGSFSQLPTIANQPPPVAIDFSVLNGVPIDQLFKPAFLDKHVFEPIFRSINSSSNHPSTLQKTMAFASLTSIHNSNTLDQYKQVQTVKELFKTMEYKKQGQVNIAMINSYTEQQRNYLQSFVHK